MNFLKSPTFLRFSQFGEETLKQEVEPSVQNSLKKNDKDPEGNSLSNFDFSFTKIDFGTVPPKLSNFKTHKVDPEDVDGGTTKSIVIDFDVEYLGDCDLQVSLMGISSGVRYEIWNCHSIEGNAHANVSAF